jgi:hypothetical protein
MWYLIGDKSHNLYEICHNLNDAFNCASVYEKDNETISIYFV